MPVSTRFCPQTFLVEKAARVSWESVLHRHNLDPPPGTPFAVHQREWWLTLDLPLAEKLRVQQDLSLYQTLDTLIQESDAELGRLSRL